MNRSLIAVAAGASLLACGAEPSAEIAPTPSTTDAPPEPSSTTTAAPEETTTTEPAPTTTEAPATTLYVRLPTSPPTTIPIPETSIARGPLPVDASLTPYNGWAIPEYIVMCESGGDWNAWNPSGAAGPYQLMPFHLGADARQFSPETQHRKAAQLWNGGRGAYHWAACL